MTEEEIRKCFLDKDFSEFIQDIINNVYAHADPNGPPGDDGRLAQGASPIFIPKRKKFKRRYKR